MSSTKSRTAPTTSVHPSIISTALPVKLTLAGYKDTGRYGTTQRYTKGDEVTDLDLETGYLRTYSCATASQYPLLNLGSRSNASTSVTVSTSLPSVSSNSNGRSSFPTSATSSKVRFEDETDRSPSQNSTCAGVEELSSLSGTVSTWSPFPSGAPSSKACDQTVQSTLTDSSDTARMVPADSSHQSSRNTSRYRSTPTYASLAAASTTLTDALNTYIRAAVRSELQTQSGIYY